MFRTAAFAIGLAAFSTLVIAQDATESNFDLARLAHPSVAEQISLTDEQRAEIARLLNARANAIVIAEDIAARETVISNSNRELNAVLTEAQRNAIAKLNRGEELRFSFQRQKWPAVLEWVAEQAGMTLVYDRTPEDTFSFRDNRSYTIGEAIDLLNGVLITKGFTLIRRDKLLILTELSKKIPSELLPEVTPETLPRYGQFELVRFRIPLGARPVDAVEKEVRPLISPFGQMSILAQSRQLLITETAGKVEAINRLVAAIPELKEKPKPEPKPKRPPPKPTLEVYTIQDVDPEAALATIRTMMGDVKSTVDRQASTISVFAVPSQQTAIKAVLEKLMDGSKAEQRARLQTFEIKIDDADLLRSQIKLAAPNSQVTIDKEKQKLIVFGSPAEIAEITSALDANASQLGSLQQTIAAYPVDDPSDLNSIVEMLQAVAPEATVASSQLTSAVVVRAKPREQAQIKSLIDQIRLRQPTKARFAIYEIDERLLSVATNAIKDLAPLAIATWDSETKRLMVRATPTDHDQIRSMLDTIKAASGRETLDVYQVSAEQQSNMIKAIQNAAPDANVTWDAENERLIGFATAESHKKIQSVIKRLQVDRKQPTLKTFMIDPSIQASLTNTLARIVPEAQLNWDAANQRLVVLAHDDDHVRIANTIAALSPHTEQTTILRVYSFPPQLTARVNALVETVEGIKPPKVVDDSQPGELALLANAMQHEKINELLDQLKNQNATSVKLELSAFPVSNADATSLQAVIAELFPNAKVLADAKASRLMVWTRPENQTTVAQAIKQLDVEKSPNIRERLLAYDAPGLEITNLTTSLGKQFPTMVLTFDRQNNKIMAWGNEKSHTQLAETLKALRESNPPKTTSMKVYPTSPRSPNDILPLLSKTVSGAWFAADQQSESIIARATDKEHQLIRATLEQLPAFAQLNGERRLVAYDLSADRARNIEDLLQQIAPQSTIGRTRGADEILVWGTRADHERIRAAFDSLDESSTNPHSIAVYKTVAQSRGDLATLISSAVPKAQIIGQSAGRFTVWASQSDHTKIAELVAQLDTQVDSPKTSVRTYRIDEDVSSRDLVELLTPDLSPGTSVVVSADRDRLIVRAVELEHDRLALVIPALIQQLEAERHERSVRVFPLNGANGTYVIEMLGRNLGPQSTARVSADGQRLIVRATKERMEQLAKDIPSIIEQLAVTGDDGVVRVYQTTASNNATLVQVISSAVPRATITSQERNQLTVWATPSDHERIQNLAHQLEIETASPDSMIRVYPLRGVSARDLMEMLSKDIQPGSDVTISSDAKRLIVRATKAEQMRLESVIQQLVEQLTADRELFQVRTYALRGASGPAVIEMLGTDIRPDLSATVSNDGQRLVIRATEKEHERFVTTIPNIIDQLADTSTSGSVRVFDLGETSGPNLIELLNPDLPPTASATLSDDGKRLIVRAEQVDQKDIAARIPILIEQLGVQEKPFNKIYRPRIAKLETVVDVFDDLFPRLLTAIDEQGQFVAVTATADEHEQLQSMFEAMEQGTPSRPIPRSYSLKNADADSIRDSIRILMRRNNNVAVSIDRQQNLLLVVAPQREQDLIAGIVREFDSQGHQDGRHTTKLYGSSELYFRTLENTLQAALSKDAFIDADSYSQKVIVRASESDHAIAAETVKKLTESLPTTDSRTTKIYAVTSADPEVVENIFDGIAPRARVQADRDTNTVTVTASVSEHQRMADVLTQIESNVVSLPVPITYTINSSEPIDVYNALTDLYDNEDVSISWSPGSDSLLVVAKPKWHELVSQVIDQFNTSDGLARDKTLKVYSLTDVDGNAARDAIESLLSGETPEPRVEFDSGNNQFLVFATSKQHAMVTDALSRMKREQRDVEFFQLQANDAFSLELAIDGIFRDLPESAAPQVDSNVEKQELIVRATKGQMQEIRELLSRMGESIRDPERDNSRRMRTLPFYGDVNATMQRMREIWPQMHANELRIIYPADYEGGQLLQTLPKRDSPANSNDRWETNQKESPSSPPNLPTPSPSPIPQLLSETDSTSGDQQKDSEKSVNGDFESAKSPEVGKRPAPIVVIPNEGRLTISSDDAKALDEFEAILRLFAAPERSPTNDVAIYGLRNASAVDTAQLLREFFKEVPTWGRLGKVIVVPEQRLNAIVVHANQSGRAVVKDILTVLDADDDDSRTKFNTPRIVQVHYSAANRIIKVLQSIYKTQLTSGAGRRKQIDIPEGVDSDVAAVLEQLNASSAGPLLTLEVDETTNSIIVLGPPQLAEEVTGLIGQLDQRTQQADTRGIRVISLKNIRSELLSDVLSELNSPN